MQIVNILSAHNSSREEGSNTTFIFYGKLDSSKFQETNFLRTMYVVLDTFPRKSHHTRVARFLGVELKVSRLQKECQLLRKEHFQVWLLR